MRLYIYLLFSILVFETQAINYKLRESIKKSNQNAVLKQSKTKEICTEIFIGKLLTMATQAEKNFEKLHTSGRLTENTAQKNAALLREFVTKQNSLIAPGGMLDDDNEYCLRAHNANNQLHRLADKYITASKVCEMTSSKAVDKNTNFDIISAVINNLPEKQKDGTWQSGDKGRLYDTVFKNQEFTKKDKADAKNLIMKTPHKTFAPVYKKIQHVWQDGKTDNITIDINAPIGR